MRGRSDSPFERNGRSFLPYDLRCTEPKAQEHLHSLGKPHNSHNRCLLESIGSWESLPSSVPILNRDFRILPRIPYV
jgi:hypothetical protein